MIFFNESIERTSIGKILFILIMLNTRQLFLDNRLKKNYRLYFVNSDGLYLICKSWSIRVIEKWIRILDKVEVNLIVK